LPHGYAFLATAAGTGVVGMRNASTKRGKNTKAAAVAVNSMISGSLKLRFSSA